MNSCSFAAGFNIFFISTTQERLYEELQPMSFSSPNVSEIGESIMNDNPQCTPIQNLVTSPIPVPDFTSTPIRSPVSSSSFSNIGHRGQGNKTSDVQQSSEREEGKRKLIFNNGFRLHLCFPYVF